MSRHREVQRESGAEIEGALQAVGHSQVGVLGAERDAALSVGVAVLDGGGQQGRPAIVGRIAVRGTFSATVSYRLALLVWCIKKRVRD